MSISNQKYYLDLNSGTRAPVTVHVSQGDVGRAISFSIYNGTEPYIFTTESVSVHGTRIDGANFGPFPCTYSENVVLFETSSSMTAIAGSAIAEIVIVNSSGNKIGSANFAILVENSVFPNGVSYSNDPSVYESILQYVQTSQSSTISNAVNSSKSYTDNQINSVNERISNLVVAAGGDDITEVVDARMPFTGSAKTSLKSRLDLFLECTVKGTTEDIDG